MCVCMCWMMTDLYGWGASSHSLDLGVCKLGARLALWFDQHNKQDCRSEMVAERSREDK